MGNNNHPRPKFNSNKKGKRGNNEQFNVTAHVGATDYLFSILTAIFLGMGGILASDEQFRWPGISFFIGGILSGACGFFIHMRHRALDKKDAAIKTQLALCAGIVCFITLGASQWWFKATRDSEVFNTLIVNDFFTRPAPGGTPPFNAAAFLPNNEIVLHPINHLLYVRITNLTNLPRRLVGVSVETSERRWGLPKWERLCPVEMRGSSLIFMAVPTESSEMSDEYNFEKNLGDKPISPHETVSGWLGWECPKGNECNATSLRVAVLDASGATTWQVVSEPPVVMTLEPAAIRPIRKFNLLEMHFRTMSSCR
jgi:hypothetical protein